MVQEIENMVKSVVTALVDHPDEIEIQTLKGLGTWVLEVKVAQKDFGKVVGREGRMADALRTILKGAAGKAGASVMLQIIEPKVRAA